MLILAMKQISSLEWLYFKFQIKTWTLRVDFKQYFLTNQLDFIETSSDLFDISI